MAIRMLVTDLDNTLLRSDKSISEYTASVFRRCRERGIKIVFATARPIRAVKRLLNLGVQFDACVYHNGAVIEIGDTLFQQTGIEPSAVCQLVEVAKQIGGMRISVEINDAHYTNFDAATVWPGIDYILTDFCDLPKTPADKIVFITASKIEIDKIESLLDSQLYWEISENEVLMVMHKDARKRNAVEALAAHFGIALSDVIAFGDDHNDIEMLRACGIGVAVENAIGEAKAAADFICGSNDGDGPAKWIEAYLDTAH